MEGKFYVDAQTYAYVYYEKSATGYWNSINIRIKRKKNSFRILYEPFENRWILKSFNYYSKNHDTFSDEDFICKDEYLTTKVEFDNVKGIPLNEQMQFTDIFADEAVHFDSTNWHDYTIIENDSLGVSKLQMQTSNKESEQILSTKVIEKRTTIDIIMAVFKKIKFEYGLGSGMIYMPVNNIKLSQNGNTHQNQVSKQQNIYLISSIGYKFNRKFSINYTTSSSLNKQVYYKNSLVDFGYLLCLKKRGKQFFAEPTLGYSFIKSGYKIGKVTSQQEFVFNGKIFDEKSVIYSGLNQQSVTLGLNLKTRITPLFYILLGGNYNFMVKNSQGIIANKNLFTFTAFEPFSSNFEYYENEIQTNNSSIKMDYWQIRFSFVFEL